MSAATGAGAAFAPSRELPGDAGSTRAAIYGGAVFQLAPTPASRALVGDALAAMREALGAADDEAVRDVQARLAPEDFFARIGALRRTFYLGALFHDHVRRVIAACGWDPGGVAFDPLRLRVVAHRGHEDPRAAAVYYPHRDTWYGHPQSLITWWIPLHDLAPHETFVFHPERFAEAVPNNSEIFDYDAWVRDGWSLKVGWQDRDAGLRAKYPGAIGNVDGGPALGFAAARADNLLFSGAQFHRTLPQTTGRTRFSLDFRVVALADHARGLGAPNADNRSRGSALPDYVQPPT